MMMFAAGQKQFRDCQTYEERIEWLHSEFGQRVLSNRPRIYEAYKNGISCEPNIIPPDFLQTAIEFMNNRQISDPDRPFISDFTMDLSILNLFYKTDVRLIADTLLYGTNPHPPIFIPQAQIAQRPSEDSVTSPPPSFGGVFGFGRQRLLNKPKEKTLRVRRWLIDGLAQGKHSPFSLLIGVAFSNFLKEFVSKGYLTHLEREGQVMGPHIIEEYPEKPLLDSLTQLLLGKGDVVIAHQKLAHRGVPNYSQNTRNMIYFRVASFPTFL